MKRKYIIIIILLIVLFPTTLFAKDLVTLEKCVDGDTADFKYKNKILRTRFIAIDAPESTNKKEPYGNEASKFTCDLLTNANNIYLEYDPKSNKSDKYGRNLAWVHADDTLIQEALIENGLAKIAYVYGDYLYVNKLEKKERIAKEQKLNMWSDYVDNRNIIDKVFDFINDYVILQVFALGLIAIVSPYLSVKVRNKLKKKVKI